MALGVEVAGQSPEQKLGLSVAPEFQLVRVGRYLGAFSTSIAQHVCLQRLDIHLERCPSQWTQWVMCQGMGLHPG